MSFRNRGGIINSSFNSSSPTTGGITNSYLPQLWTWGRGVFGQSGNTDGVTYRSSPVLTGSNPFASWKEMHATYGNTFGIKPDGTLWGWGTNSAGQLGLGDTIDRSSPTQIGALTNWSISGPNSRMAINSGGILIIKTDGTLWAWGGNGSGELGLGDTINRSSPVQVGTLTNWYCIASEGAGGVIASNASGQLFSWGQNNYGQLGSGTKISRSSPVQVGALTNWASNQFAGGYYNFVVIKVGGTLWSWGANNYGQLASGTKLYRSSPAQVGALTTWSVVALGGSHGGGITTSGALWIWGANYGGGLGQSTLIYRSSPIQVGTLTTWNSLNLGSQNWTTATKTDGTIWAWGYNPYGQLGQNNTISRSSPVQVPGLTYFPNTSSAVKFDNSEMPMYII